MEKMSLAARVRALAENVQPMDKMMLSDHRELLAIAAELERIAEEMRCDASRQAIRSRPHGPQHSGRPSESEPASVPIRLANGRA